MKSHRSHKRSSFLSRFIQTLILAATVTFSSSLWGAEPEADAERVLRGLEWRGTIAVSGQFHFSIFDTVRGRGVWIAADDPQAGIEVVAYEQEARQLTLRYEEGTRILTMGSTAARIQLAAVVEKLKAEHPGRELVTTASGLQYMILAPGSGDKPVRGALISAHYTGRLSDGTVFDSSVERGEPLQYSVGVGEAISGWDEALIDMQKGEKRVLIIPPQLGYGERAVGPIPPNSTLIFEVERVGSQES